jgi:hypothetical protein
VADGFEHAGEIARLFVHDDDQDRKVTVRTYAATANGFKRGLADRFDDPEIVREYRRARMPRFVWIVEAVDRSQRTRPDGKCVMGEVIIDATSDDDAPNVLAVRLPGLLDIRGTPNAVRTTASLVRSGAEHEP